MDHLDILSYEFFASLLPVFLFVFLLDLQEIGVYFGYEHFVEFMGDILLLSCHSLPFLLTYW